MANRRMFSKEVTNSDRFLALPISSQALYFHLGMNADDDGFVQPTMVMRMCGTNADDMTMLVGRKFLIPFEDGVIVIKDWKINNDIKNDRHKPTIYVEHLARLGIEKNRSYSLGSKMYPENIQNGSTMDTQYSIGEVSKGKVLSNDKTYVDEIEEMKSSWKQSVGTSLRNHLEENLKAYRSLSKELGGELGTYLNAVRMIRADHYQKRTLQARLINFPGLQKALEEVEAYMQGQVDRKSISAIDQIP